LIETKHHVNASLQVQQQLEEPQHQKIEILNVEVASQVQQQQPQQMKSSYNKIKMVDIYQMEEKVKQSMIDEIEGQNIKPDEINVSSKCTRQEIRYFQRRYRIRILHSKQIYTSKERERDYEDNNVRSADSKAISKQWAEVSR
jgi:hypothetical protein